MDKKKVLDIENKNQEFESLDRKLSLLNHRLLALAMDYKHYIDSSIDENKIYKLRDNIQFRLFASKFHIQLLFNHITYVERIIEENTKFQTKESNPGFINTTPFAQQVTSLFDSFIYHTVSVFDYLGTITNYISGVKKEKNLMWTQLAKSVRDKNNPFSKTEFSQIVDQIDREFLSKLYDYRAELIHRDSDFGGFTVVHSLGYYEKVTSTFFAGKKLIQNFKKLRELNRENDITIRYVAIWIINESIEKITDFLFAMKKELESKDTGKEPFMYRLHPETNEKLPVSSMYWNEHLYKKNKK